MGEEGVEAGTDVGVGVGELAGEIEDGAAEGAVAAAEEVAVEVEDGQGVGGGFRIADYGLRIGRERVGGLPAAPSALIAAR